MANRLIEDLNGRHGDFFKRDAEKQVGLFQTATVDANGIARWKSNGAVPPKDLMELWQYAGCSFDYEASLKAQKAEDEAFLERYRKQHVESEEEVNEARAAFGPGTTMINVITGKKTRL